VSANEQSRQLYVRLFTQRLVGTFADKEAVARIASP
jgi:hypothetical protein